MNVEKQKSGTYHHTVYTNATMLLEEKTYHCATTAFFTTDLQDLEIEIWTVCPSRAATFSEISQDKRITDRSKISNQNYILSYIMLGQKWC